MEGSREEEQPPRRPPLVAMGWLHGLRSQHPQSHPRQPDQRSPRSIVNWSSSSSHSLFQLKLIGSSFKTLRGLAWTVKTLSGGVWLGWWRGHGRRGLAWTAVWAWRWAGISRPLSVSLTHLPLSPVALIGDTQRFWHGGRDFGGCGGIKSTVVVLWVFSTRERTWEA
jgi:hypothetical protein